METTPETKLKVHRSYTKRTKEQKIERLGARIATLKAAHQTRQALIERLEGKLAKS